MGRLSAQTRRTPRPLWLAILLKVVIVVGGIALFLLVTGALLIVGIRFGWFA